MPWKSTVGGAVFVATRDGDLDVYANADRAGDHLEVIDVEDGEYPVAYRVDGAVLALLAEGGRVVAVPTGEVDEAELRALIGDYARRVASAPRASTPLDFAESWLQAEWQRRWPRRPRWLDRRLHGAGSLRREELAAPAGGPGAGLVRPQRLRELVAEVLSALPPEAVRVTEGTSHGRATMHLQPRAAGAVDVVLLHGLTGVDAVVGDSSAIEITAPYNVNYGPPERGWDEDLRVVLQAVSGGQVLLDEDDAGRLVMVDIPGSRLGVTIGQRDRLRTRHPAT